MSDRKSEDQNPLSSSKGSDDTTSVSSTDDKDSDDDSSATASADQGSDSSSSASGSDDKQADDSSSSAGGSDDKTFDDSASSAGGSDDEDADDDSSASGSDDKGIDISSSSASGSEDKKSDGSSSSAGSSDDKTADDSSSSAGGSDDKKADDSSSTVGGSDDKKSDDSPGRHLGNDFFNGTTGIDKASFSSSRSANKVLKQANGDVVITGPEGVDTLRGVERAVFSDGALGFDSDGTGGKAYRLYQAAFDRVPDESGLGFWINAIDKGLSLEAAATKFIASPEFSQRYGANLSNELFVDRLYQNVMHRAGDTAGRAFWKKALDDGFSRADVLAKFSESPENKANVVGVLTDGFEYLPWVG